MLAVISFHNHPFKDDDSLAGSGKRAAERQRPHMALQRCHIGCLPSIVCFSAHWLLCLPLSALLMSLEAFARREVLLSCQASWGRRASVVLLVISVNCETVLEDALLALKCATK